MDEMVRCREHDPKRLVAGVLQELASIGPEVWTSEYARFYRIASGVMSLGEMANFACIHGEEKED